MNYQDISGESPLHFLIGGAAAGGFVGAFSGAYNSRSCNTRMRIIVRRLKIKNLKLWHRFWKLDDPITYYVFLCNIGLFLILYIWLILEVQRPAVSYWLDVPVFILIQVGAAWVWSDSSGPVSLRWLMKFLSIGFFVLIIVGLISFVRGLFISF